MSNPCPSCGKPYEGAARRCPHCGDIIMRTMTDLTRAARPIPARLPPPADREPPPTPADPPRPRTLRKKDDGPGMPSGPLSRPVDPPTARDSHAPGSATTPASAAFRTQNLGGIDISNLNIAKTNYTLQILDKNERWVPLFQMIGTGRKVFGREEGSSLASVRTLALRHIKFENTSRGLIVRPGGSLNGVYRRLRGPVVLVDGLRIRISNYILTFREAQPPEPAEVATAEGEYFLARDLWALGHLEFLRPDGRPGVRFPILNPVATILGRGGLDDHGREVHVDLPLLDDPEVSRRHAQIAGRGGDDLRLTLNDLGSRRGTWVQIRDRTPASDGDEFWLGEIALRVVASK